MLKNLIGAIILVFAVHQSFAQHQQPPGVPPRTQPPPQGHGHGQPAQGHGNQAQAHGQPAQGHGHGHGHGKPLEFASEIHNADHILEHLQRVVATKSKDEMTEEELEFHYFKLHDYDNNNKLDGVEIGKALTHFHDDETVPVIPDDMIERTVDSNLSGMDKDKNGYVSYQEYKLYVTMQRIQMNKQKAKRGRKIEDDDEDDD